MATQVIKTPALFTRITSKGRPTSWAVGLPFSIIVILLIAAFAYFASKATSYAEQLGQAQRDIGTQQLTLDAAQKRASAAEADVTILKNPGITTLTLQAPVAAVPDVSKSKSKSKKDTEEVMPEAAPSTAWGSATWGELGGKAFIVLRGYGMLPAPAGKVYHAWYEADAKPVLLGVLDPSPAGSATVEGKDLAPLAQGKRVFVALGAEDERVPAAGPVLMEAKLVPPKAPGDAVPPAADKAPPAGK